MPGSLEQADETALFRRTDAVPRRRLFREVSLGNPHKWRRLPDHYGPEGEPRNTLLEDNGGGHENADTCQVSNEMADDVLQALIHRVNARAESGP
jgi:hypothetical protein